MSFILLDQDIPEKQEVFITANSRAYTKEAYMQAFKLYKEKGTTFGKVADGKGDLSIEDITHITKSLDWNDGEIIAKLLPIETIKGKNIKSLFFAGVKYKLYLNGVGHTNKDGIVDQVYHLTSVDIYPDMPLNGPNLTQEER